MEPHALRRFLSSYMKISGKEILRLMQEGKIELNGKKAGASSYMTKYDEIIVDGKIIQAGTPLKYYAIYKPKGYECTSNENISDTIYDLLPAELKSLFTVGRLDKASEGLLLLTNHAEFYEKIAHDTSFCPKVYEVTTEENILDEHLETMAEGIVIMGKKTRPSKVKRIASNKFSIELTQGLNRQIRRMCFKLNLNVIKLKRISIGELDLSYLEPHENFNYRALDQKWIEYFLK